MSTITGTSHFVSKAKAIQYYRPYEDDAKDAVADKIATGAITIGKPCASTLAVNESVIIIDDGCRYAILTA